MNLPVFSLKGDALDSSTFVVGWRGGDISVNPPVFNQVLLPATGGVPWSVDSVCPPWRISLQSPGGRGGHGESRQCWEGDCAPHCFVIRLLTYYSLLASHSPSLPRVNVLPVPEASQGLYAN